MLKAPKRITNDLIVTDIVTADYRTAEVFRKYNIDFCCGGKLPLTMACELKGVNESEVLEELQQVAKPYQNPQEWSVDFMVDYLINVHHRYFKNNIPVVDDYVNRFISGHGLKFPDLEQLPVLTKQLCHKLTALLNYESSSLFPYIKRIIYAYDNNEAYGKLFIKTLRKLSAEDVDQYHAQMKVFALEMERITYNFQLPENACITHKVMLQKLQEFINYIWQHIFIENKILVPVTLKMEKSLLEKYTEM